MASGTSNQGIADRLVITLRAAEKYVSSIFDKLGIPSTRQESRRVLAVLLPSGVTHRTVMAKGSATDLPKRTALKVRRGETPYGRRIPADRSGMGQLISDSVEQGREAYRQHAWREAFESLRIADSKAALSPEDLALLAESAWFAGDPDAAIQARERAHADYLRQGDQCHAAGLALQLAVDHFEAGNRDRQRVAGSGEKAARRGSGECAAHGWQAVSLAYIALRVTGDRTEALQQAKLAQDIGGRLGDRRFGTGSRCRATPWSRWAGSTTVWP